MRWAWVALLSVLLTAGVAWADRPRGEGIRVGVADTGFGPHPALAHCSVLPPSAIIALAPKCAAERGRWRRKHPATWS